MRFSFSFRLQYFFCTSYEKRNVFLAFFSFSLLLSSFTYKLASMCVPTQRPLIMINLRRDANNYPHFNLRFMIWANAEDFSIGPVLRSLRSILPCTELRYCKLKYLKHAIIFVVRNAGENKWGEIWGFFSHLIIEKENHGKIRGERWTIQKCVKFLFCYRRTENMKVTEETKKE